MFLAAVDRRAEVERNLIALVALTRPMHPNDVSRPQTDEARLAVQKLIYQGGEAPPVLRAELAAASSTTPSRFSARWPPRSDPTPLHEQVAAEIRRTIAEGEAGPGDRLPPARDFAAVLGVNRNTVFRAFRLLRDEGLLEFRRGRGVTVAGTPERGAVTARAKELIAFARQQGYRRDELVDLIESLP